LADLRFVKTDLGLAKPEIGARDAGVRIGFPGQTSSFVQKIMLNQEPKAR
jgi:hypothetical protein